MMSPASGPSLAADKSRVDADEYVGRVARRKSLVDESSMLVE